MRGCAEQLVNKEGAGGSRTGIAKEGFSADDEKLLTMLCAHCSIFLRHLETGAD